MFVAQPRRGPGVGVLWSPRYAQQLTEGPDAAGGTHPDADCSPRSDGRGGAYHIEGELVPALGVELRSMLIYFEHHVLLWKDPSVEVGIRPLAGAVRRLLAGLPISLTQATRQGRIAFSRDGVGHVFPVHPAAGQSVDARERGTDRLEPLHRAGPCRAAIDVRSRGHGNLRGGAAEPPSTAVSAPPRITSAMPESPPKPTLLVIVGPTATGKSQAAMELAEQVGGEIVSADSMQAYRGMDIGTAKPTPEERARVHHHLVDVVEPDEPFNVATFAELARAAIAEIAGRGALPIVVGGSGLYVRSITCRLDLPLVSPDDEVRARLEAEAVSEGRQALHDRLRSVDPAAAAQIHPNDLKRIVRALEVYEKSGRPISEVYREAPEPTDEYRCIVYGARRERDRLYQGIEARCDRMIRQGLVQEVEGLLSRGFGRDLQSMQAIGYKEVVAHLEGLYGFAEMMAVFRRNSRQFAKRQMTWFGREPNVCWVDVDEENLVERIRHDHPGLSGPGA